MNCKSCIHYNNDKEMLGIKPNGMHVNNAPCAVKDKYVWSNGLVCEKYEEKGINYDEKKEVKR